MFAVVAILVTLLAFVGGVAQAAMTVEVKPNATSGWGILPSGAVAVTTNNATGVIVSGPGSHSGGLLPGSVEYRTNSSPGGKPQLYAPAAPDGREVQQPHQSFPYSTYTSQYASGGGTLVHTINVKIDLDGGFQKNNTLTDQYTMVFEPCYTVNGCTAAIQPLGTVGRRGTHWRQAQSGGQQGLSRARPSNIHNSLLPRLRAFIAPTLMP